MKKHIEKKLQIIWKRLKSGTKILNRSGAEIIILSTGTWNFEEGPDFLNAKFAVNGQTFTGDVEAHIKSSDWLAHQHDSDPRYKNVKLHVVAVDDMPDKEFSPDMHTIIFPQIAKFAGKNDSLNKKFTPGLCKKIFSSLDDDSVHRFLCSAGEKWLQEKSNTFLSEIIASGFNNIVLRHTFEAAGYKKNKDNFLQLFDQFSRHSEIHNADDYEAIIWGESGLLPDPTTKKVHPEMKDVAKSLWNRWWKLRVEPEKKINWVKSGVRPLNSPERRIAAMVSIIKKTNQGKIFESILQLKNNSLSPTAFIKNLIELFTVDDQLWNHWTNFKDKRTVPASLIGDMRALDIVINVILPALLAKFAIEREQKSHDFCIETFRVCSLPQKNIRLKTAANKWFNPPSRAKAIVKNAPSAQGAIYILKNFCEKNSEYCPDCQMLSQLQNLRHSE